MSALVADWLLTYLLHSSLLIGLVWAASRHLTESQMPLREALWRVALLGGLVTASVQLAAGIEPWTGSWSLVSSATASSPPPVAENGAPAPSLEATLAPSPRIESDTRSEAVPDLATPVRLPKATVERWLVIGWAAGAGLFASLLLASYLRFRRRLRGRRTLTEGPLPAMLERLRAATRCRPVRLTRSERLGVPLARGVRNWEICLPSASLERLPLERQEIVVAHELAHLRRYDPLWFAVQRLIERLLFFQPLNVVARRELQEISEFRCDDWAVDVTRRPISLAKCLTEVAEWNLDRRGTLPVPTMAVNNTQLGRRVARLLKRSYPMPTERLPRWLAPAALTALVLTVLIAPGVSSQPSEAALFEPEILRSHGEETVVAPAAPAAPVAPASTPSLAPAAPSVPVQPAVVSSAPPPPSPATTPVRPLADFALLPTPPLPPRAPLAPRAELSTEHWEAYAREVARLAEAHAELAGDLETELESAWLPMISGLALDEEQIAELAESATELAGEWVERWQSDESLPHRLAPRLEALSDESRRESERLQRLSAKIAERLPSAEEMERLRARVHAFTEEHQHLLERHEVTMRQMAEAERDARLRAHEEIQRSLAERRVLIERSRLQRSEQLRSLSDEERHELRETLREAREELREQLRMVEEELRLEDEGRELGVRE